MSPERGERLFTAPLVAFLGAVLLAVGVPLALRLVPPDVDGAILLLADGDADGDERAVLLRQLAAAGPAAAEPRHRWAGLLAAVALQDREAYDRCEAALGAAAGAALPAPQREHLWLGDTLLANLLAARMAAAEGDVAEARRRWSQVAAQARLTGNRFAADLAARALG